jgi:hypothetical protein
MRNGYRVPVEKPEGKRVRVRVALVGGVQVDQKFTHSEV